MRAGILSKPISALLAIVVANAIPVAPMRAADPPARAAAQPNIVLVMADDLDVRLNTLAYTPHIRALLQQQGVTFSNGMVPVSLCCPSRASLLRGQYVHNHAIYTNGPPDGGFQKALQLGLENNTAATLLDGAGYRTALVGKYLNGYPLSTSLTYIPPGWDEFYSPSSDAAYSGYSYTMNTNGVLVPYGNAPEDYMTDVLSRTAVNFITRTAAAAQPLFLFVSTYAPHAPATPALRHANLFTNVIAPRGGSFNELDNSDKPPLISTLPLLTPQQIADIDARYRNRLRSMQAVDEMIASLVDTLQDTGILSNTYFIFTSDNGYHMGQHRFPAGKYTNYEEDLRVPFIVRGPGVPVSITSGALVSTIDLLPTFAEIANIEVPAFADGRSLLPLLNGSASSWRQVFFLEQYPFASQQEDDPSLRNGLLEPPEPDSTWRAVERQAASAACQSSTSPKPIYTGIRGVRYKYVEHHACDHELYDMQNDPFELNNIYGSAPATTRNLLAAWLRVMETCVADTCRAYEMAPPITVFLPHVMRE
jgi:N-acetylglucosamine-6-sulfatase